MKRLRQNPFEFFGLTPQIVKELDDETLFKLIKSMYRVLQMHFHPDRGGDLKRALELNLAFDALNLEKNPQSFHHYKKSYLKRLSRKTLKRELEELKELYRKELYLQELLKERFWNFLEQKYSRLKDLFSQGFVLKIKLLDIVSQINLSDIVKFKKGKKMFKEIILAPDLVLKRMAGEEKFRLLRDYRFLGSVKREHLSPWLLMERDLRDEKFYLKDYMSKDTFVRDVLFCFSPEIRLNHYLFFYTPKEPQRIYLEGLVLKLEEITQLEFLEILKGEIYLKDDALNEESKANLDSSVNLKESAL